MDLELKGKIAVVTGGGRGIGMAIASGLAAEGADVAIAEIDEESADKVADELKNMGMKSIAIRTDVT